MVSSVPKNSEIFPSSWELQPGNELQLTVQTADAPHLTASVPENLESAAGVLSLYHDVIPPAVNTHRTSRRPQPHISPARLEGPGKRLTELGR